MSNQQPETQIKNEKGLNLYCRYWNEDKPNASDEKIRFDNLISLFSHRNDEL